MIAISPLVIDAAYADITTTSVFSQLISTGVVWSNSFILEYKYNMTVSGSK